MYKYLIIIFMIILVLFVIKKLLNKIEKSIIFVPEKLHQNVNFNLNHHKLQLSKLVGHTVYLFEDNIKTKTDEKINIIYFYNPKVTNHIIYSHGNCGNIESRISLIYKFAKISSFVIYDYRGFGKSTGTPDEKGVYDDIYSVWNYLLDKGIESHNITLYGNSLGSSITAWLGYYLSKKNKHLPKNIIMQSGFSSIKDIAYDFFPPIFTILLQSNFNSKKYIKKIGNNIPILISHSAEDEIINIHHRNKLIKKNPNVTIVDLKGTHNDLILDQEYIKKIEQFINS